MAELLERCGRCDRELPASDLQLGVGQYAKARLCAHCRRVSQLPPGDYLLPTRQADTHVVPTNDLREHETSRTCWCRPTQDNEEPHLWVHHSMDRREEYEEGRPLQ